MFKIFAKLILGTSLLAAFFPPGVPSNPPFPVSGTKVDGYVPTVQADLTVAWEAQSGGGGSSITSPDGTTTVTRLPTFNPVDYGAGTSLNQSRTSGSTAAGTSVVLATGDGANLAANQYVAIPGAGPAHLWAAVTPTAPTVGQGGNTVVTLSAGTELLTVRDYQGSIATGQGVKLYWTGTTPANSGGNFVEGTTYYLRLGTHRNTFTIHPTALDATNNTNAYDITTAGTATISMSLVGATTRSYRIVGLSDAGGYTVRSSATSTTTGVATPTVSSYDVVWWDPVQDGSSNYCHGYLIYGRTDDSFCTKINACPNAMKVTMQAGGYTNCAPTDIGKYVVYGGNRGGILEWYDNATRTWIVSLGYETGGTYNFPAASACTIVSESSQVNRYANLGSSNTSSGEGAGTVTGTSSYCYYWRFCGDTDFDYDYPTYVWRTGKEQQELQISGTPSAGTYDLVACAPGGAPYQVTLAYNADGTALQTALRTIPGLAGVVVSTTGSTPNYTHTITFEANLGAGSEYGLGDVPEMKLYWGNVTGGTFSLVTTVQGARYNLGDQILSAASSSGTWQELIETSGYRSAGASAPSFSSTRNTTATDGRLQIWVRRDTFYPVTSPSAQQADVYFGRISTISTDTLTVSPATTTTVAANTPVFRNDLPAWQAAFAAALASDAGGTIETPNGFISFFSRADGYSEWTELPDGGNAQVGLFALSSLRRKIGFELNGAYIFWRALEVPAAINGITTAVDGDTDAQYMIGATQANQFFWNNGTLALAPAGEPYQEGQSAEGALNFINAAQNTNENETVGQHSYRNARFVLPSFGSLNGDNNPSPGSDTYSENCTYIYGGGGHDPCVGDGTFIRCRMEGNLSRWSSTGIYSDTDQDHPIKLVDCDFIEPGPGGLRIRNHNFQMIGGSVVESRDNKQLTTAALTINGPANGDGNRSARVWGVLVSTSNRAGILCDSPNTIIQGCVLRNCGVTVGAGVTTAVVTGVHVDNCDFVTNGWARRTSTSGSPNISFAAYTEDCLATNNTMRYEETTSDATQGGVTESNGISIGSANSTGLIIANNTVRCATYPLVLNSSFTGTVKFTGNKWYGANVGGQASGLSSLLQAGNGALVDINGDKFDGGSGALILEIQGTSSARYRFKDCTFATKVDVAAALTGTNSFENCAFDSSTATTFQDAGTIIRENEFAVEPTLSGATLSTSGNRVAGSLTKAVTLSASQNNYAWPTICDTILVDANAAYSITGIVPRAKGTIVKVVNVDSSDVLTLSHGSGSSSAANKININAGSDLALGSLDGKELICTENATMGWSEN